MTSFAHIVNPVKVKKDSDLFIAQPISFESMRIAKEFCNHDIRVELFSAQYSEDLEWVPEWFTQTPNLDRSVLDYGNFVKERKLPLLKDILDRLFENSKAQYLVYTNADISLKPHFYQAIADIVESGYDSFMINRRTISSHYSKISELPLMYEESGKKHPGLDCFVFNRKLFPFFDLKNSCIGAVFIGLILALNCAVHSAKFKIFKDLHLTFHLGDDQIWRKTPNYTRHNREVLLNLYNVFKEQGHSNKIHCSINDAIDLRSLGLH